MNCPKCNHPAPIGAVFCGECGARMDVPVATDVPGGRSWALPQMPPASPLPGAAPAWRPAPSPASGPEEAAETYGVPTGPVSTTASLHSEFMGARNMALENDVAGIALWYRVWGVLMVAGSVVGVIVSGLVFSSSRGGGIAGTVGVVVCFFLIGFGVLSVQIGSGLMNGKEWARMAGVVLTVLGALGQLMKIFVPPIQIQVLSLFSCAYATYQAIILNRAAAVFQPEYQQNVLASGVKASPFQSVVFFVIPAILFGLFLVIGVFAGIGMGLAQRHHGG